MLVGEGPIVDSIPIMNDLMDVFLTYLPGITPECDIDFPVKLHMQNHFISNFPYLMGPLELKELNVQL